MTISDDIKQKIQEEYDAWQEVQYYGRDKAERQDKAAFYTPPALSIKMLEKFDTVADKDILDPTLGAGGLISAAIIAGADYRRCYGIELDPKALDVAKRRLAKLGVPPHHLVQGDALDPNSYDSIEDDHATLGDYAIVSKLDDGSIQVVACKDKCMPKDIVVKDRMKANDVICKLKSRGFKLFKV